MPTYAYSAGAFYRVERDATGRITSVQQVPAEEAVPVLIHNFLEGNVSHGTIKEGEQPTGGKATPGEFADQVISQAFEDVSRRYPNLAERREVLHRMFGDDPTI